MNTRWIATVGWWLVTIATLVVLDDLVFGPVFWIIARTLGAPWAVVAVFAVYMPAQLFLVDRGSREEPGRVAAWWLHRLDLERRSRRIQENVESVRARVTGGFVAVLLSPVIGGVLPPLLLWRQGWDRRYVRAVSLPCAAAYAATFALVHGVLPAAI